MTVEFAGVKFYKTKEVAEKLSIRSQTVRHYIRNGKIKAQRVGKSFLISEHTLKEFLKIDQEKKHRDN
jgi:excisionase family DNA binding protein